MGLCQGPCEDTLSPLFVNRMTSCLTAHRYNYVTREEENRHKVKFIGSSSGND